MRLGSHLIVPDYIWPPGRTRVEQTLVDKKAKQEKIKLEKSNTLDLLNDASLTSPRIGIMRLKPLGTDNLDGVHSNAQSVFFRNPHGNVGDSSNHCDCPHSKLNCPRIDFESLSPQAGNKITTLVLKAEARRVLGIRSQTMLHSTRLTEVIVRPCFK